MVSDTIQTSGQLRGFLLSTMQKVRDGKLAGKDASVVVKLAQQTTENLYAELKSQRLELDAGRTPAALGELKLS